MYVCMLMYACVCIRTHKIDDGTDWPRR